MNIFNINFGIEAILRSNNPCSRTNQDGHITASGLVIRENKVLLIFHPYIKKWFQPGGHIDEGELPIEAAIREVYEETGLVCVADAENPEPIDVDVHGIPANPAKNESAHLHIDLLYQLKVLREEKPLENIDCAWFSFDEVESTRIQRALNRLSA
ncbi:NUDIX hydrolase [Polynucleobacter sp. MWH-UH25E]|uniref:NUDIX hydrolase n=1 Tax=Polynucleobacter sp. MWH-UH25E TaxID=1855616 RepID=UPI001BFDA49B|nr:NUDIX domain-containing protein [Polynucleobacter sp. MWH-UH25E]QWD61282.1 NUDIX domain-containing protein [Polynucleobacter sp. MWH-UH25E]